MLKTVVRESRASAVATFWGALFGAKVEIFTALIAMLGLTTAAGTPLVITTVVKPNRASIRPVSFPTHAAAVPRSVRTVLLPAQRRAQVRAVPAEGTRSV